MIRLNLKTSSLKETVAELTRVFDQMTPVEQQRFRDDVVRLCHEELAQIESRRRHAGMPHPHGWGGSWLGILFALPGLYELALVAWTVFSVPYGLPQPVSLAPPGVPWRIFYDNPHSFAEWKHEHCNENGCRMFGPPPENPKPIPYHEEMQS